MTIAQAGRPGRPRADRRLEGFRTRAGAQQRVAEAGPRPGALPGRGERRREITLIRVLTGALHRDSGSYEIEGQPVTTADTRRVADRRRAGRLPGAQPVPAPVGRREHVHGPTAIPDRDGALPPT